MVQKLINPMLNLFITIYSHLFLFILIYSYLFIFIEQKVHIYACVTEILVFETDYIIFQKSFLFLCLCWKWKKQTSTTGELNGSGTRKLDKTVETQSLRVNSRSDLRYTPVID